MAVAAIYPGEHLAEELDALDMSAAELARRICVPANRVTQILKGHAPLPATEPCASVIFLARVPSFG